MQPASEIGQDIVMGDGENMFSNSNTQLARQDDFILSVPREESMLARQQQQVISPNQMIPRNHPG